MSYKALKVLASCAAAGILQYGCAQPETTKTPRLTQPAPQTSTGIEEIVESMRDVVYAQYEERAPSKQRDEKLKRVLQHNGLKNSYGALKNGIVSQELKDYMLAQQRLIRPAVSSEHGIECYVIESEARETLSLWGTNQDIIVVTLGKQEIKNRSSYKNPAHSTTIVGRNAERGRVEYDSNEGRRVAEFLYENRESIEILLSSADRNTRNMNRKHHFQFVAALMRAVAVTEYIDQPKEKSLQW